MNTFSFAFSRYNRMRIGTSTVVLLGALALSPAAQAADSTLVFKPRMTVSVEHDDNIYTENKHIRTADGSFITRLRPSLEVQKTSGRNSLRFDGNLEQFLFSKNGSNNNYLNGRALIGGRYFLAQSTRVDATADYSRINSRRGDNEFDPLAEAKEPMPIDVYQLRTSLTHYAHGFGFMPRIGIMRHNFHNVDRFNGTPIDRKVLDRTQYTFGARFSRAVAKHHNVYVDGESVNRDYAHDRSDRDSKGERFVLGYRNTATEGLMMDLSLGYMSRRYDATIYKDIHTLAAGAHIKWAIQPGSDVEIGLTRYIGETTAARTGGALGTLVSASFKQAITTEWSANIGARYRHTDYVGGKGADNRVSDRVDKQIEGSIGLSYLLTPALSLDGNYTYTKRNSNTRIAEYDKNVVRIGVNYDF